MWTLAAFWAALLQFHASEYALAYLYMRDELSLRSLLISKPYLTAMAAGVAEHLIEARAWPAIKRHGGIAGVGLALVLLGEAIRKTGMITARHNFTHDIQQRKRANHQLITHGIYRYCRHPGYVGWLIWAVGTQVLLLNPVCTLAFAVVSWRFFSRRIAYEEATLVRFFGQAYLDYAARTPTWIPGIR